MHDLIAARYETNHPEIYNPTEQRRLKATLTRALAAVATDNRLSLDFGSGTGNLTGKLLAAGRSVCAADVSPGMLERLRLAFPDATRDGSLVTTLLTGDLPLPFAEAQFGFVAAYSVLHHVPDYLGAVRELARLVSPGGILYLDHELNAEHWRSPFGLRLYRLLSMPAYSFGRAAARLKAVFGRPEPPVPPRGQRAVAAEGDIHIYADDCIDWTAIRRITQDSGLEEIPFADYLLCRETARFPVRHIICRHFATDIGIYVGRKA